MRASGAGARDLVLVGGGHAHVQVLRRFAMERPPGVRVTVVLDTPIAVYSGMVPGMVAGMYAAPELEIDVVPLARRAGARVVLSRAVGLDAAGGRIELEGRPPIPYDAASFDVGSTVAGAELPGVRELALPTRPIGRFVALVEGEIERARRRSADRPFRVLVVGAGVGGIELAFTLDVRLEREGIARREIVVLQKSSRILPGSPPGLVARVERAAARRGIVLRCDADVLAVTGAPMNAAARDRASVAVGSGGVCPEGVRSGRAALGGGDELGFDLLVWVTGAVGQPLFRDSGLEVDDRDFVLVRPTLQLLGYDDVFAVGDCATLVDHPGVPKAGVYAVRQGPYLIDNLLAHFAGGKLRAYHPQRDFLALLNLGDGTALGTKWGFSFRGRWVMDWKDRIDRRFMRRFQVLAPTGEPIPEFPPMQDGMEMLCGGCAAKVGQSALERALARVEAARSEARTGTPDPAIVLGLTEKEDAAAVRTPRGDLLATTIDVFTAFTDDPWLVGRVAALNAASDLLAKGVEPRWALALVAVPEEADEEESEEVLFQALAGARAALDELGVTLLGGHTTRAARLMVGFAVDGFAAEEGRLLRIDRLRPGQRLVLTKPLGTGVLFHADMQGLATGRWVEAALASVASAGAGAAAALRRAEVEAATDVTGFGLIGHLGEMLRASGVAARLRLDEVPALPGALELLGRGLRSTFHAENERARRGIALPRGLGDDPRVALLFDPQTSGGFLCGVEPSRCAVLLEELRAFAPAVAVGEVIEPRSDGAIIEIA